MRSRNVFHFLHPIDSKAETNQVAARWWGLAWGARPHHIAAKHRIAVQMSRYYGHPDQAAWLGVPELGFVGQGELGLQLAALRIAQ